MDNLTTALRNLSREYTERIKAAAEKGDLDEVERLTVEYAADLIEIVAKYIA